MLACTFVACGGAACNRVFLPDRENRGLARRTQELVESVEAPGERLVERSVHDRTHRYGAPSARVRHCRLWVGRRVSRCRSFRDGLWTADGCMTSGGFTKTHRLSPPRRGAA